MTPGRAIEAVPVTVLSGFLGAGKTTLLNVLLRQPALAGAAVVVNEFGAIGIDHLLVERVEGDMLTLTTGCLCCAARGDLVTALADLLGRRARGEVDFDRIVIETTGLADPGPVLNALLPSSDLGGACRIDRLVTVVEAVAGNDTLDASDEARRQVALADLLVLSKTDLVRSWCQSHLRTLETRLRGLNPSAPIVRAADLVTVLEAMRAPVAMTRPDIGHRHSRGHLAGIDAVGLRAGLIDARTFERFLDTLVALHGADLLRLKGLMATSADPDRPVLINVVQHGIHPAVALQSRPDSERGTRLVAIVKGGIGQAVADLWDAFFGPPCIDRPDAAGLSMGLDEGPGLF